MKTRQDKTRLLFQKVIIELKSFCFNTTNLIDDFSTDETDQEKQIVENAIINMLSRAKINRTYKTDQ